MEVAASAKRNHKNTPAAVLAQRGELECCKQDADDAWKEVEREPIEHASSIRHFASHVNPPQRVIVALSGGKASAWCAWWATHQFPRDRIVLYFNDTRWEHPDLYRFLSDLSRFLDLPLTIDSDGRSVAELAFDMRALPNNRMPFCSRVLKAERLQRYVQDGDCVVFGICPHEAHRAMRLVQVYDAVAHRRNIRITLRFPLLTERPDIDAWLATTGITPPLLYRLGFRHNNCSGGCVRAGKQQWLHLLRVLPDVYAEREALEAELSAELGKRCTFLPDMSLRELRELAQRQLALPLVWSTDTDADAGECIGVCSTMS